MSPRAGAAAAERSGATGPEAAGPAETGSAGPAPSGPGGQAAGRTEILRGLTGSERIASTNAFLLKAELAKGEADHGH